VNKVDKSFWLERWARQETKFHEGRPNRLLTAHFSQLGFSAGQRVLVPFCGKAVDMAWFLEQGIKVIGIELAESAVVEFFQDLNVTPDIEVSRSHKCYKAVHIEILVGDFFTVKKIPDIDFVYDRAAIVALPPDMRERYSRYLTQLTKNAPQLVITFVYDQQLMDGPPFSVDGVELERLYGSTYTITELAQDQVKDRLRGTVPAQELCWLLGKR